MTPSPPPAKPGSALAGPGRLMLAGIGAFLALAVVGTLATMTGQPLLIGSFGASCVLLFGFPNGPFSPARNVVGGHLLCSFVGLACLTLLGPGILPMALAVALSLMLMMASGTTHPPAGGNSIIIFMTQPGWLFLLTPTLAGALLLVLLAWVYWKARAGLENAAESEIDPSP